VAAAPIAPLVWVVFGASFLFGLGYGVSFLLPPLFASFGADEAAVGTVLGVAAVATLLAVLLAGHVADAIGRARAIAVGGLLLAGAHVGFGLAGSYGAHLWVYGVLLGIGWGLFYCLSQIIIALLIPAAERARYFLISHAFIMGGIGGGPIIWPLVARYGLPVAWAFFVVAVGTAVAAVLFFAVSRALGEGHDRTSDAASSLTASAARRVLASEARYPIIMVGIGACVFAGFHAYQTSLAASAHVDYSLFFVVYTVTVVVFRVVLSGHMARLPLYAASAVLLVAMTAGSAIFLGLDGNPGFYALAAFLLAIGYGITYALIKAIVANEAPPGLSAQAMQMFNLSYFVGIFGFPFLGGHLIVRLGTPALVAVMTGLAAVECLMALARHLATRRAPAPLASPAREER
jgi:MFS family permease